MLRVFLFLVVAATGANAQSLRLVATTTTTNSGLMDVLLPAFEADSGIRVEMISAGTGEAIEIAKRGDVDVILVHHRPSEDALIASGDAIGRRDLMYNDFVIIGPKDDPAGIRAAKNAGEAMGFIAKSGATFAGRGDESGTHRREQELWAKAGVTEFGSWHRETGAGMGATLNISSAMNAYVLSDRATWLAFGNKGDLQLLYQGGEGLLNPYGVMLVNPARFAHVQAEAGKTFIDWLVGEPGQKAIALFRIDGQQMFCPMALPDVLGADAPVDSMCQQ